MVFSEKQNEFIRKSNHRYNLKVGAVRSGKSYADIAYTIPARLRAVKDKDGLNFIIGVSKETIERNVLQPMREIYTEAIVGTINSRNIAYVCGVPVYCIGAEKVSQIGKIQGSSIKYCYGDEIAKWNQEIFTMLQSRLDKPYSCFDGACNPEYPGHWLKQFIDREDIDIYIQHYTIFDNPFLSKKFIENLCKEYAGTVYYRRFIEGEWALAEGLIYPMYENAKGNPPEGTRASDYRLSIDYGTMNAFAALLWEKHGSVWYATRGYYYSGRDSMETKTDEQYGNDIDDFIRDLMEKREKEVENGEREFLNKMRVIIDPSAASFIALLRKKKWYTVIPADNDVLDGIRETATCMNLGYIKISPKIKEFWKEISGYVWDDSIDERPVKIADHFMDSCRYFIKTMRLATQRRS